MIVLFIYILGFIVTFYSFIRSILNSFEAQNTNSSYYRSEYVTSSEDVAFALIGGFFAALMWPVSIPARIIYRIAKLNLKSDGQKLREERKALEEERKRISNLAKEYQLPLVENEIK